MKTARPYELKMRIYELCNRKQYFNAGTNTQYDMMFHAAGSEDFSCRDVAVMIWVCSVTANLSEVEKEILTICEEIEAEEAEARAEEKQAEETIYESYNE